MKFLASKLKPTILRRSDSLVYWQVILALAGGVTSVTPACIAPLAAVATLAGRTLSWRSASVTLLGAVAANQFVGFFLLGYPRTATTVVWGPIFFVATLVAMAVARRVAQPVVAFVASFVAYEAVLAAYTFVTERSLAAFAPGIVTKVALANVLGMAVLGLVYVGIGAIERMTAAPAVRVVR